MASRAPLPVTIVAGWWADGTAALAARALRARPGRVALVHAGPGAVDDAEAWGSTAVEEELVHCSVDRCPCCAVRLDLIVAVTDLARRRDRPDQVVVRLGPTADVAAAVQTFLRDPDLRSHTQVVSVVTPLDVAALFPLVGPTGDLVARPEVQEPLALADRVVLGAGRPVRAPMVDSFAWTVHAANRRARLSDWREPDLGETLLREAGASPAAIEADVRPLHPPPTLPGQVGVVLLAVDGPLDRAALSEWMDDLHHRSGGDLLRLQGILAVDDEACRWVARGVRTTLDIDDGRPWAAGEPRRSRLWLVGRGLDPSRLGAALASCAGTAR